MRKKWNEQIQTSSIELPVSGVLVTGNPGIDRIGLFVPQALVEKLVVTRGRFSHLATRLADRDDSPGFAEKLETRFAGAATVTTWREETQDLIEIQRIRQTAMDLLALAIMAIAATGIANTVLMAAHERVREIGTLRAMGLDRRGVVGTVKFVGKQQVDSAEKELSLRPQASGRAACTSAPSAPPWRWGDPRRTTGS